jgi:hypothetical protein
MPLVGAGYADRGGVLCWDFGACSITVSSSHSGSQSRTGCPVGTMLRRLTSITRSASLAMSGWPPLTSLRSHLQRNRGSISRASQRSSNAILGGRQSTFDIWPYNITMAAMWRGIGEVKNAILGKRISWLWIMMVL